MAISSSTDQCLSSYSPDIDFFRPLIKSCRFLALMIYFDLLYMHSDNSCQCLSKLNKI